MKNISKIAAMFAVLAQVSCAPINANIVSSPKTEAQPVQNWSHGAMIAAANPMAVDAGLEILRKGGSAIDAAIAVQAMLGLVEPQSSGIGGGAFMVYYDAKTGDVQTYDGREIAPKGATPDMFMENGRPMDFWKAVKSGKSTGTPGVVAMLHLAWQDHGKIGWAEGFKPATRAARDGYPLTERTAGLIRELKNMTTPGEGALHYFYDENGNPYPAGHIMHNPEYAQSLDEIGQDYRVMYDGHIAQEIVANVQANPIAGTLSMEDMRTYQPSKREPVCRTYRLHLLCGMGPPSSGAIGTLAVLGILENFDMPAHKNDTQAWHLFIEAQRLAYIDRDTYVADDRFINVPIQGLLDKEYLRTRAALISPDKVMEKADAGVPQGASPRGRDATGGVTGTSHFVIVDNDGNVVSMTTTVENLFGSQRMVGGFFLNNQLTDFSFAPTDAQGQPIVNSIAAGKKPRSSMAPTIVFDRNGQFELAIGSPGGNAIIAYVTKSLIAILDWGMTPQEAVNLPNVIARRVPANMEYSRFDPATLQALQTMGHTFTNGGGAENSGLHAIMLSPNGLVGGVDTRREGVARRPN